MTTLIFVHGTGVREPGYSQTFAVVKGALAARRPDLRVIPCYWGGTYGAELNAGGASIPGFAATLAEGAASTPDPDVSLWYLLYQDPLYELRTLALASAGTPPPAERPGDLLAAAVRGLEPAGDLENLVDEAGLQDFFTTAHQQVATSRPYAEALASAQEPLGRYRQAIARSIVATAIVLAWRAQDSPPVAYKAQQRDALVRELALQLGPLERGLGSWITDQLMGVATTMVQNRRGALTDSSSAAAGDIVLYQGSGSRIRDHIRQCIAEAARDDSEIVVLAHSLGGIACVDLLVLDQIPEVRLLVTAGSQAPYLYEINALHSLRYGDPLPSHFPPWLNIYAMHDFLSYIGAQLFPGRIVDVEVACREPFPQSHSAYWHNPATWDALFARLDEE